MFAGKVDPALLTCVYWNEVELAGFECRKTTSLPWILAPALCSNCLKVFARTGKYALSIRKCCLDAALYIQLVELRGPPSNYIGE